MRFRIAAMLGYMLGFIRALFAHGAVFWGTLVLTYLLGVGIFADYAPIRDQINAVVGFELFPNLFPLWLVVVPVTLWLIARFAHKEALRFAQAAKLRFDGPHILLGIPLFDRNRPTVYPIANNDIVCIYVHNKPFDLASGRAVSEAYGKVEVYNFDSGVKVLAFDYPRWTDNPKPGYTGSPSDFYPPEYNYRTLQPNNDKNRIDILVKSNEDEYMYGFPGISQRVANWRDPNLRLSPGVYAVHLTVTGTGGLRRPAEIWLKVENTGASLRAERCRPITRAITTSRTPTQIGHRGPKGTVA